MTIPHTVITPPRASHAHIDRPRLRSMLNRIDQSRVTAICAPAGFGKTGTALLWADALAQQGRPVLWLAARAGIFGIDGFLQALGAACAANGIDWLASGSGDPAATFVGAVAALPSRPVLVIDDAQILPPETLDLVTQIVMSARDATTVIIISRSARTIPLARLRSLGYLVEVGVPELCFSFEETCDLARAISDCEPDREHARQIHDDTQGWPAGAAMALSIENRCRLRGEIAQVRPSGLRREFETYFDEEVMSLEERPIRDFLVATIVLDELTPSACAAVTGADDARSMLQLVEESGLFLHEVDTERSSYRYHPLFRQMVLRRLNDLDPARASELQRRASMHFAAVGDSLKAVDHARQSGDEIFLADQLERLANPLTYAGYLYLVDDLASSFASSIFESRPNLALAIAWRRIRSMAFESAEMHIAFAEEELRRRIESDSEQLEARALDLAIQHRRLMLAAARDDMEAIKGGAESLLRQLGDTEPYLSCTLLAQLMTSRRELYHFQDMLRLEAEVRRALSRPGSDFASIALKASIAPTLAAQGKVETAEALLREALAYARNVNGTGVAAIPALPLAEILYDRGELEEARSLVDEYLPVARQWGFVDQIASGHLVRARLQFNSGDVAGAYKTLEEMQVLAIECGLDRLRACAVSEHVRMSIRCGEPSEARAVLNASGLVPTTEPVPTLNASRRQESVAIAIIRLEMQEHRLAQARRIAKRWSEFVRHNGAMRSSVTFGLLLCEIAILAGDRSEARRAAREAVALAAQAGWTQIFIDEGEAIRSLLHDVYSSGPELSSLPDLFGKRLVAAFSGPASIQPPEDEDFGLSGRLVNREVDILRMVGGGLRNREIGDRLGLTEGTVKWYMQQIYDKLGVRRRPQAVSRARQLGVLA